MQPDENDGLILEKVSSWIIEIVFHVGSNLMGVSERVMMAVKSANHEADRDREQN